MYVLVCFLLVCVILVYVLLVCVHDAIHHAYASICSSWRRKKMQKMIDAHFSYVCHHCAYPLPIGLA